MKVTAKKPPETEKQIQSYLIRRLVAAGFLTIRQNSGMQMVGTYRNRRPFTAYQIANNGKSAGYPDVTAMKGINGQSRVLLIEVKGPRGRLQDSQKEFSQLAAKHGVDAYLVRSIQDVDNLLATVAP